MFPEMVDDDFTCIKEVTKNVHITLPTAFTSNEISGISDILESWKRQYIRQLQAVVVSYKNVSLTSVRGYVKNDCPVVHYDVKATFELFYPTAGSILKGKINRISHDYIGCLVHNTINVTIDRPSNVSDEVSNFVALDRLILFQVTRLDFKRRIIRVKGTITQECIDLMKESDLYNAQNIGSVLPSPDIRESVTSSEAPRKSSDEVCNDLVSEEILSDSNRHSHKKKKTKRSREKSLTLNSSVYNSSYEFDNSTDTSSQISSSRKNKKHMKDLLSSPPLFNESLESDANEIEPTQPLETSSKKHRKKVKTEFVSAINDINNDSSILNADNKIHTGSPSSLMSPIKSPQKKKPKISNTRSPERSAIPNSMPGSSPKKQQKRPKSETSNLAKNFNVDSLNIKKEIHTDSSSSCVSPIKSKKNSKSFPEKFSDVYEMMEALSSFEPSLEAQLLCNENYGMVKTEPLDTTKKAKKRKLKSLDEGSQPRKKQKTKDGSSSSNKSKDKVKKKKNKDKSKKDSKKDKKKKSKDKIISTKKKLHGYKTKLKKKNKDKNKKSSKKEKKSKT